MNNIYLLVMFIMMPCVICPMDDASKNYHNQFANCRSEDEKLELTRSEVRRLLEKNKSGGLAQRLELFGDQEFYRTDNIKD